MKANTAYLSTRYISVAYEDIASKMYAKSFKFNNKSFLRLPLENMLKSVISNFFIKLLK